MKGSVNVDKTKNESNKRKFDGSHKNVENYIYWGNVGVGSWFSVIKQAYAEFVPEGRLVWVELDGVPFKFWSGPTFKRIAAKWGELLDVDDYDESNLHSKRICILSKKDKHSEDPFGLYPLLNKENIELARKVTEEDHSLSHPPGFTPEEGLNEGNTVNLDMKDYGENERDDNSFVNLEDGKDNSEWGFRCANMGYNNGCGCIQGYHCESLNPKVNLGDSVGNSGGILCIWDPNSFRRSSFTRSDYFVIVRGVWLKSGIDLMIVVVYAPQEAKEKRMLWDYLAHVSNQWIFISFIYNAGLDEVPLGGSAYTRCLKSASKMSKLDRFFVFENLLSMCPNITAITLERFILDHRPILLREVRYDYGPIPFRFYRYWLEVDGFDKLVRDSWNVAPVNKKNAIRNFMGKLKFLKDRIRSWLSIHRSNSRGEIYFLKEELRSCDEVIDKGDCSNEVVHKRTKILKQEIIRFDKPSVNRACIDTPFPVSLSIDQKEVLGRRISKEEVKRAVWDCGVDKSPGPDGFSFSFYRHFWPVIEKDVFEAVDYFFMYGEIPNGCNSNFIALIPKILDANMVKDFVL
ncbi:RNA-directed DNA polymerase, eukaryota [Tanacetum coccineum]